VRDELGEWCADERFGAGYPVRGAPGISPAQLAMVTVLQFTENLTDRQAADAVRGRIDWKYALGLDLADPGFDSSILSEFRTRLVAGGLEQTLLDAMLARFRERGLLKARGRQRTDSTHVLAAVRAVNRLESVGETMRAALNALAVAAPDWLAGHADPEWPDRYGRPFEEWRLPKGEGPRKVLGEQIGRDGHRLLAAAYDPSAPSWLRALPTVQTLRRAWVNQFYVEDDRVTWRDRAELPPASLRFDSPYDPDARYGNKRSTTWNGYKAHFTETCDADCPHFVIHVETTPAPVSDVAMTAPVHEALRAKDLLPGTHLVDAGYVDADLLIDAQAAHGIELVGPVRPDTSWQAQAGQGYAVSAFAVDWEAKTVTCPQGHRSVDWVVSHDPWGTGTVHVSFAKATCRACPSRPLCTRAKAAPRALTLRRGGRHEAIQAMRKRQDTPEWRALYGARAGIEGCLSQGIRLCGLRRSRYLGLAKTHLQHVATAVAINLVRLGEWWAGHAKAPTRRSHFAALNPAAAIAA
jgi:transposase